LPVLRRPALLILQSGPASVNIRRRGRARNFFAPAGDWIYETDGGGIVSYTDDDRSVVSMIKIVKSRDDYDALAPEEFCVLIKTRGKAKRLQNPHPAAREVQI